MSDTRPILMWFRRDLRLGDHQALSAAFAAGRPVIPVFIYDEIVGSHGAAPLMRLGQSIKSLSAQLEAIGSRLILRKGPALKVLQALIAQTGASSVMWSRQYDPDARERDASVKAALKHDGIDAQSFAGQVMFEPWDVQTGGGSYYRVYTPMWKNVRDRNVPQPIGKPSKSNNPDHWPASDSLADWAMDAAMERGASIVSAWQGVGEDAALDRLDRFIQSRVDAYKDERDFPAIEATSGLSENLAYGEISPRTIWHAGWGAVHSGKRGAEHFVKELVWREFSYHLAYHTPHITQRNWREEWDRFPWNEDETSLEVIAWKQGRTGVPFVDAAMREMYVTGRMHNRARMIVASYLTKHLMTHWRVGMKWFEECLTDWDPAANAMGWQWAAGSGPDAAPYFRIFNPVTQLEKFDKGDAYSRRWIAEGTLVPSETALSYFDAIPMSWGLLPDDPYPEPLISLSRGRERALEAYTNR